jgi:hypothetical protein
MVNIPKNTVRLFIHFSPKTCLNRNFHFGLPTLTRISILARNLQVQLHFGHVCTRRSQAVLTWCSCFISRDEEIERRQIARANTCVRPPPFAVNTHFLGRLSLGVLALDSRPDAARMPRGVLSSRSSRALCRGSLLPFRASRCSKVLRVLWGRGHRCVLLPFSLRQRLS